MIHAILVNIALGVFFSVLFLVFGAPLYRAMGGEGASLRAALDYFNVVFTGAVLVWVMNALATSRMHSFPETPQVDLSCSCMDISQYYICIINELKESCCI